MLTHRKVACLATLLAFAASGAARAQSTAFTYQGRLKNGAQPASGLHDFRFSLFNAASGGVPVGTPQCADNIAVTEGVFTATLDFGPQFATTEARFLQIEVRADTGLNCGNLSGFVTLGPRQPINPAPAASHANAAFSLDAPDGSPANAVFVDNDGKVGVGTTTPTHTVHIAAAEPTLALQDTDSTSSQVGYVSYRDSAGVERAWVGYGTAGSPEFSVVNARPTGDLTLWTIGDIHFISNSVERMIVTPTGNVGIGTTVPSARLDVRGNIRLGSSGQYSATAGSEDLRIIRGEVGPAGDLRLGSGFTPANIGLGQYEITFTTPFASTPVVTATPYKGIGGSTAQMIVMIDFISTTKVRFFVRNTATAEWDDWYFDFIAIGPR